MPPHPDAPGRVVARLGLVADTHLPDRCAALPPALFDALRGVDLVLHAGDVGELRVLDELARIAPVIAVHGNDDTPESQRELPYRQLVAVGGVRLVLTHGHQPDRAAEMAARADDAWGPKLDRWAAFGVEAGARAVIHGHTHVPLAREWRGVRIVNPGAIASGSPLLRQTRRSVARLDLRGDGTIAVRHTDLDAPGEPFVPQIDWGAGFRAAHDAVSASILAPDLAARLATLRAFARTLPDDERAALWGLVTRCARPCWVGERAALAVADLLAELPRADGLAAARRDELARLLAVPSGE